MTTPDPLPPPVGYTTAKNGCTYPGCGTQDTDTLSGHVGRRCRDHAPGFSPDRAVALMMKGESEAAISYCQQDVFKEPCPVCRLPVTVLDGGRLAWHYQAPGLGSPCPGSFSADDEAGVA
jgi:hypothetical protein